MCCDIHKFFTQTELDKLKAKGIKYINGYKIIYSDGTSGVHKKYKYYPGTHTMKRKVRNYNRYSPKGFHFYMNFNCARREFRKDRAYNGNHGKKMIKIQVPVDSIIGLEQDYWNDYKRGDEGVSNSIIITKEAWQKAGLKRKRAQQA